MSCGTCSEKTKAGASAAIGAPQSTGAAASPRAIGSLVRRKSTGQIVSVWSWLNQEKLDSLERDARRILGQIPAPSRDPDERYRDGMAGKSVYLSEPTPGIRKWAERILALDLTQPVAEVFYEGGTRYVNESDLEETA